MPEQGLSDREVVERVAIELGRRGVPVPATLRITMPRYHASYDMTMAGITLDAGPRVQATGTPERIARLADLAQIIIRSAMVTQEARRLITKGGRTASPMPVTPAWGLACHPYALALLSARAPDGAWMRDAAYWSNRSGRTFDIQASSLRIDAMDGTGLRHREGGSSRMSFSADAIEVDWFKDRPRESVLRIDRVLPDTIMGQLAGRRLTDLVEMPHMTDERIAEAVSGLEIASVSVVSTTTWVRLEPTRWIEAAPLPLDADPACLAVRIPHR